jgi:hypothetical protein
VRQFFSLLGNCSSRRSRGDRAVSLSKVLAGAQVTAARDAVKKEALRKAGIGYHEVVAGHTTPAELKRLVEKLAPAVEPVDPG